MSLVSWRVQIEVLYQWQHRRVVMTMFWFLLSSSLAGRHYWGMLGTIWSQFVQEHTKKDKNTLQQNTHPHTCTLTLSCSHAPTQTLKPNCLLWWGISLRTNLYLNSLHEWGKAMKNHPFPSLSVILTHVTAFPLFSWYRAAKFNRVYVTQQHKVVQTVKCKSNETQFCFYSQRKTKRTKSW